MLLQPIAKATIPHDSENLITLGRSFFTIPWVVAPSATTARDGLGPLFNANTCTSCHVDHGGAVVLNQEGQPLRGLVFKLSQPSIDRQKAQKGMPTIDLVYGNQIAINGTGAVLPEAATKLKMHTKKIVFPDGSEQTLSYFEPYLDQLNYGKLDSKTKISLRQPNILQGLGLISDVPDEEIAAWADPEDKNQDGISGRVNYVYDMTTGKTVQGRFNWKASQPSVLQQVADAAANDMGLTNPLYPEELCTPAQTACQKAPIGRAGPLGHLDLPERRLHAIAAYVNAQPPLPSAPDNAQIKAGEKRFTAIGCVACHRPTLTTKNGQSIHPYSDFLIHDMGEELADARIEFDANEREWRTAPLWNMQQRITAGQRFLHDARAANIQEAILWHGGEAEQVKQRFMTLPKAQREQIIHFVETR